MNPDTDLPSTHYKNQFKMDHRSKWKHKTIKLLQGNIGENLDELRFGSECLNTTPKSKFMKEIINKLNFIKN